MDVGDLKTSLDEMSDLFDSADTHGFLESSRLAYVPGEDLTDGILYLLQGASNYAGDRTSMQNTLRECMDISNSMVGLGTYNLDEYCENIRIVVTNAYRNASPQYSIVHGDGWGPQCHFAMTYNEAMAALDNIRLNEIEASMNVKSLDDLLAAMNLKVVGSKRSMRSDATREGKFIITDETIDNHNRENSLMYGDYEDILKALLSIKIQDNMFAGNYIYNEFDRAIENSGGNLSAEPDCGFAGFLDVRKESCPTVKQHLESVLRRWALSREDVKWFNINAQWRPEFKNAGFIAFPSKPCALTVTAAEDGYFRLVWEQCKDCDNKSVVVNDQDGKPVEGSARTVMGFIHHLIEAHVRCGEDALVKTDPRNVRKLIEVTKPPKSVAQEYETVLDWYLEDCEKDGEEPRLSNRDMAAHPA